jgi:hypothetical protein
MGMKLLPAAAMMEMAVATAATATSDAALEEALLQIADMAISAPIILPAEASEGAEAVVVSCQLELLTGRLTISYSQGPHQSGHTSMQTVSASGQVAMLPLLTGMRDDATASSGSSSLISAAAAPQLQGIMSAFPQLAALAAAATATKGSSAAAGGSTVGSDAACGIVEAVHDAWHSSGYLSSPAQVDAAFHLGVVAPDVAGARVPVALGNFLVPVRRGSARDGSSSMREMFASTTGAIDRVNGKRRAGGKSSVASFYLKDAAGSGSDGDLVAVVDQLETIVVDPGVARRQRVAVAGATSPAEHQQGVSQGRNMDADVKAGDAPCSYEVEWVAEQPTKMAEAERLGEGECCLQEVESVNKQAQIIETLHYCTVLNSVILS